MTYDIFFEGAGRKEVPSFPSLEEAIAHCHKFQYTYPRADLCIENDTDSWVWDGESFAKDETP